MDIEEILETVRKENPEIYQVIIAFLKGEISREEIDIFISLSDDKDRAEWVKQQIEKRKNIEREIDV
ncbi:TPA: hypothetical protein ACIRJ4_001519 [Streptococcus suis]|uniref:Uncharacterized protein n=4 Tax=Streptococcus suis TaxID=1307 RepID=A0A0H3MWB7_STRS4|nr:hypothetical protein [Streptococcus suis]ABP90482.1 hypothetical protein SSU05_1516 [Streptococcus suis 05ZYH33]ABP92685.1 hypothetical protein SSU98_1527 [Streptococcus suis 98HAH33]QBX11244.1 hypothetical protein JavanS552_0005 [Streptococcus satellite phage Javan552]QBX11262.1 hypothetical protein JavanS555_0005 [Streptococcus satellite phage Javan555]QBX11280.1 hypothetical protein JavanS556_0005 [Streptococcus satellite phage Javan556]QBX11297.1 hypothetical protein JavanS557_0005 [St